jgi:hypothetical protein
MSTKPATTDGGSPEAEPLSAAMMPEVKKYLEGTKRPPLWMLRRAVATIDALRSELEEAGRPRRAKSERRSTTRPRGR